MDLRPRTVSQAMTRFQQRAPHSRLDRSARRNAARRVRRRLARPRIEDLTYVPPPAVPPRTARLRGADAKMVSNLVDRLARNRV